MCRKVYAWCWAILMVCGAVEACCMNEEWRYLFMVLGCAGRGRELYVLYSWRGNIVHCSGRYCSQQEGSGPAGLPESVEKA
jgi:hypothetical protein